MAASLGPAWSIAERLWTNPPGSSGRRATFERGRRGDVKEGMAFPADLISSRFPAHITVS